MREAKHRGRRRFAVVLGASLIAVMPCVGVNAASTVFDGVWRIQIVPTAGECKEVVNTTIAIVNGEIAAAQESPYSAIGGLDPEGRSRKLSARLTGGGHVYRIQGAVRGTAGFGVWSSNTLLCGGNWNMLKAR